MKKLHAITDVPGIKVGHASDFNALTGCTVILCEEGAVGAVDIRGTATGTRQIDALTHLHLVDKIHALLLSGGRPKNESTIATTAKGRCSQLTNTPNRYMFQPDFPDLDGGSAEDIYP